MLSLPKPGLGLWDQLFTRLLFPHSPPRENNLGEAESFFNGKHGQGWLQCPLLGSDSHSVAGKVRSYMTLYSLALELRPLPLESVLVFPSQKV